MKEFEDQNIKMTGVLELILKDEFGNVKEQRAQNLVVTVGKNYIASRMAGNGTAVMSHMAVGSGAVAPNAANTALGTELDRVALAVAGGTPAGNVVTYTSTFNPGVGTGAVTEAGIFNNASAGTMLCRTTFAVINKAAADTLTINWNVTVN